MKVPVDMQKITEFVLTICLPPLAVFVHTTFCRLEVLICSLLTALFWFPGTLYALWFCFIKKFPTDNTNP